MRIGSHGNKGFLLPSSQSARSLFLPRLSLSPLLVIKFSTFPFPSSSLSVRPTMLNFHHPSSSSSEKERLRALVGLDNNKTRMNSDFFSSTTAANGNMPNRSSTTELPESPELVSLLQKQDQIITELYGELESCKNDLTLIKEQSAGQFDQNRRVFDELRAQILKNNLGGSHDGGQQQQLVAIGSSANAIVPHHRLASFHLCSSCRELNELVLRLEKEKQKLQSRLLDAESDASQLRRQDGEYFRKVRESVALADQAVLEKNETLIQLKHAQTRIESVEKELKESLVEHQSALDHYRKSAQQRYEAEIEALKSQLNTVTKSELDLKLKLGSLVQERDDLASEKIAVKGKTSEKRKEMDERMKHLQSENLKLTKSNKDLNDALKETERMTKLRTTEFTDKIQSLERLLTENRTNSDSGKSSLNLTKKENLELRERLATAEKEIWQLRQWKQRLEKERDETVRQKEIELKEAVRIVELNHDQTKMELERLLSSQNAIIFKLKEECKMLTDQLERVAKNRRSGKRPDERF